MSEPNDEGLSGLGESVRRVAEEGFDVLLQSRRNEADRKALLRWAAARCGCDEGTYAEAVLYVLDLLATLPKGTSLCIK